MSLGWGCLYSDLLVSDSVAEAFINVDVKDRLEMLILMVRHQRDDFQQAVQNQDSVAVLRVASLLLLYL